MMQRREDTRKGIQAGGCHKARGQIPSRMRQSRNPASTRLHRWRDEDDRGALFLVLAVRIGGALSLAPAAPEADGLVARHAGKRASVRAYGQLENAARVGVGD